MGHIADKLFLAGFHLADAGQIVEGQQDAPGAAFLQRRGNGADVAPGVEHRRLALLPGLLGLALGDQAVDFIVADQFNQQGALGRLPLDVQQFPGRRVQQQHPARGFGHNHPVGHGVQHRRQGVALVGKLLHRDFEGVGHSVKGGGQFSGFIGGRRRRAILPLAGRQLPGTFRNRRYRAGRPAQQQPAQGQAQPAYRKDRRGQ